MFGKYLEVLAKGKTSDAIKNGGCCMPLCAWLATPTAVMFEDVENVRTLHLLNGDGILAIHAGERLVRGIITDAITIPMVITFAYVFKKTIELIDFKVLAGCISNSTKIISQMRNAHHVLGGSLNHINKEKFLLGYIPRKEESLLAFLGPDVSFLGKRRNHEEFPIKGSTTGPWKNMVENMEDLHSLGFITDDWIQNLTYFDTKEICTKIESTLLPIYSSPFIWSPWVPAKVNVFAKEEARVLKCLISILKTTRRDMTIMLHLMRLVLRHGRTSGAEHTLPVKRRLVGSKSFNKASVQKRLLTQDH
ncbi:hypothetical protein QVD17_21104 [Tagetes erecta]|uniref:Uncharacterized protein n=1 Tax=Tagetes erecta TaxID=13708 RepID=A0AAD8NYP4_TARER|nr:hypothetical protein QVD17_21104 [Tagetes erecta]